MLVIFLFILYILLFNIQQVKQIMEEAVTRKFVHEESGSITSLCGSVFTINYYFFNIKIIWFIIIIIYDGFYI